MRIRTVILSELQIIIVDNDVPEKARPFVRLELSEDDRLIGETLK